MPPIRRRALAVAIALTALALPLAACGSSDGDASPASSTTTTNSTTSTTAESGEGAPATGKAVASAGCGSSTTKAVALERRDIATSDRSLPGESRWYLLTTPDEHDGTTPLPLVLDFHGLSEGAQVHEKMSAFSPKAQDDGFIVAFPNGTGSPVRWQVAADPAANPDLAFVTDLLDTLEADLCVDTSRIYATGLSNGAMMSSTLGCTMADRFAAIAPVAGILDPSGCPEGRPLPVLTYHGTEDPILLFNGGVGTRLNNTLGTQSGGASGTTEPEAPLTTADLDGTGYPANAQAWAERNGCTGDPTDERLTETITRRTWDCPEGAPVVFDIIEGGGHSWPGSEFSKSIEKIVGPTDTTIDATDEIWSFFTKYQLPPQ